MIFSAFVTPATPRTPAGGRACGTPSPVGGLAFRPRLIRRCARIRAVSAAFVRKFYLKSPQTKCPALVLPAPSGPHAKKKGADHRPSARRWPGHVHRGTEGASNCTNGLNYGPATAKSAQMDLARGFARWLLRDDPDTDQGIFSERLSIPMVVWCLGARGRWVSGSGMHRKVVPLRASTWGRPEKLHERAPARLGGLISSASRRRAFPERTYNEPRGQPRLPRHVPQARGAL